MLICPDCNNHTLIEVLGSDETTRMCTCGYRKRYRHTNIIERSVRDDAGNITDWTPLEDIYPTNSQVRIITTTWGGEE